MRRAQGICCSHGPVGRPAIVKVAREGNRPQAGGYNLATGAAGVWAAASVLRLAWQWALACLWA